MNTDQFSVNIIQHAKQPGNVVHYSLLELAEFVIVTQHVTSHTCLQSRHARYGLIKIEYQYFTVDGEQTMVLDELYYSHDNQGFIDRAVVECKV